MKTRASITIKLTILILLMVVYNICFADTDVKVQKTIQVEITKEDMSVFTININVPTDSYMLLQHSLLYIYIDNKKVLAYNNIKGYKVLSEFNVSK